MQKQQVLKISKFAFRWGIAAFGLWWVFYHMSWHDHVRAVLPGMTIPYPEPLRTAEDEAHDDDATFQIVMPNGKVKTLSQDAVWSEPDKSGLQVTYHEQKECVLGVDLSSDLKTANRLLLAPTPNGPAGVAVPAYEVPDYHVTIPHPRVQVGVIRMIRAANPWLILAGLAIFPLTILITSIRWHELSKPLDIQIPLSRIFELNMVGLFFNTFMPGSTGGDAFKAIYVARQTHHRTRAVMSVLVDRAVGLVALIILGGAMAAFQWQNAKCRQVALGAVAIMAALCLALFFFYEPNLRKYSGLDFLIGKLPMQKQVNQAIETMHIYARHPLLSIGSLIASFPVHMVVIISAMLCGMAFGLPIHPFYYWMAVPVIVLAGSIPISPQGAGVMEYFAIILLEPQGVTVAQAFALTMSIRLVQIFWNLTGGYFVIRGDYHAPTKKEKEEELREDVPNVERLAAPAANEPSPNS